MDLLKLNLDDGLLKFFFLYKTKEGALGLSLCLFNSSSCNNFIVLANVLMVLVWVLLCLHKIITIDHKKFATTSFLFMKV